MQTDTLIIGCGIAGATAALRLSDNPKHQVTVLTRASSPDDSNTALAQGGIVTRGLDDSPELLVNDILQAGAGLSSRKAAQILATEGPKLVQSVLIEGCNVHFDTHDDGQPYYGLEAAHSVRRIVHVGDKTGAAIANHLLDMMAERPNITLLTSHTATDLLVSNGVCKGAWALNQEIQQLECIYAGQTILATGGVGQLFQNTTNPTGARGDGLAMAYRAGAHLVNLEYVQFHPTALYSDKATRPLVSEAVRGEGAILLTPDGRRFMSDYAPQQMELASRDVVAFAIHHEMQVGNYNYVLLDIVSQSSADTIRKHFPALIENTADIGIDPTIDPIPVTPAAHYLCGGVSVNEWGCTTVPSLYAIGEVSCTGLHGANRLASTSLLEGLVWGDRVARHIEQNPVKVEKLSQANPITTTDTVGDVNPYWQTLRHTMWQNVGIVRTQSSLQQAYHDLNQLAMELNAQVYQTQYNDTVQGIRNAVQVAQLITRAAQNNSVSRGSHYRADTQRLYADASNH